MNLLSNPRPRPFNLKKRWKEKKSQKTTSPRPIGRSQANLSLHHLLNFCPLFMISQCHFCHWRTNTFTVYYFPPLKRNLWNPTIFPIGSAPIWCKDLWVFLKNVNKLSNYFLFPENFKFQENFITWIPGRENRFGVQTNLSFLCVLVDAILC